MTDASRPQTPPDTARRRLQPHHAVYGALLVVVVVCVVVLYKKAETSSSYLGVDAIDRLIPVPDAKILQQDTIGIDLADGYTATLSLNGTPIPENDLTIVPQLNQITFTPGPDKFTELLPAQQNCLAATYWQLSAGPSQSNTQSWCFTVL